MIRDHQRALDAHRHVTAIAQRPEVRERRSYGAHCHKLAVLVHQAGVAAALHHTAALKSTKPLLLDHLAEQLHAAGLLREGTREALLAATREADLAATWQLTREVKRCLEWYRRLAHSLLGVRSAAEGEP